MGSRLRSSKHSDITKTAKHSVIASNTALRFPYRDSTFHEIVEHNGLTHGQVAKELERMFKQNRLKVEKKDGKHVYAATKHAKSG